MELPKGATSQHLGNKGRPPRAAIGGLEIPRPSSGAYNKSCGWQVQAKTSMWRAGCA